jgi:scyllo-inositol 2-dehydrogenase (NADP+)
MPAKIINRIVSLRYVTKGISRPFISHHHGFELKAFLERNTKRAAEIYTGVTSYDQLDEIINDKDIELIVINTPNDLHYEHARICLLAGKHVLVVKPVSVTSTELKDLFLIADQQDRQLLVYQNRHWDSDFQSVVQVLESQVLGKLVEAHFRFDRYKIDLGAKAFKETQGHPGNGLLYDLGPHLIDQAICLFGKPVSSHKITAVQRPGSAVADYFSIHLSFPGHINVFLTGSLLVAKPQAAFVLHGTKGSYIKHRSDVQEFQLVNHIRPYDQQYGVESDGMKGCLTTITDSAKSTSDQPLVTKGSYSGIYDAIYQTIRDHTPFPVTMEQVLWQIGLLQSEL